MFAATEPPDDGDGDDDGDASIANLQVRLQFSSPFHDESRLFAPNQLLGRQ